MWPLLILGSIVVGGYLYVFRPGQGGNEGERIETLEYTDKQGRIWHLSGNDARGWDVTAPSQIVSSSEIGPLHYPPGRSRAEMFAEFDKVPSGLAVPKGEMELTKGGGYWNG